jgi:hypothetical protein
LLRRGEASAVLELGGIAFTSLLTGLAEKSYIPAALESERRFAELAGVSDVSVVRGRRIPRSISTGGDVFFRDDSIYYLYQSGGDTARIPSSDDDYIIDLALWEARSPHASARRQSRHLIAGVIIPDATHEQIESALKGFLNAIEETFKSAIAAETRQPEFNWQFISAQNSVEELNKRLSDDDAPMRFSKPEVEPSLQKGADVLADQQARSLLREVSEAGFARETDMLSRRGRKEEEVRSLLEQLKAASLMETQFLLQCRKNSAPLTRLVTKEQLAEAHVASLLCPTCNRSFDSEILTEGYLVSELGRRLLKSSHWMTVWLTLRLFELGISDSIMWNLEESGEEVDILADFLGDLWIFELKDREFGPGDAHPFRYRQARYGAKAAIIVTTDKVSPEAKRIFMELGKAAGDKSSAGVPLYIEGLDEVTAKLSNLMNETVTKKAIQALQVPSMVTGFNISSVLSAKLKTH